MRLESKGKNPKKRRAVQRGQGLKRAQYGTRQGRARIQRAHSRKRGGHRVIKTEYLHLQVVVCFGDSLSQTCPRTFFSAWDKRADAIPIAVGGPMFAVPIRPIMARGWSDTALLGRGPAEVGRRCRHPTASDVRPRAISNYNNDSCRLLVRLPSMSTAMDSSRTMGKESHQNIFPGC